MIRVSCSVCAGVSVLVLAAVAGGARGQDVVYSETFEVDDGGWTAINISDFDLCFQPGVGSLRDATRPMAGGHPGGFVSQFEDASTSQEPLWRAGVDITVEAGAAYGGFLRYDRRIPWGNGSKFTRWDDVYLQAEIDGEQVTLIADTAGWPPFGWFPHRVPLKAGVWRKEICFGEFANEEELIAVLENLTEVKIAAEYREGKEDIDIDNVMLIGPSAAPQSTFEFDTEGWTPMGLGAVLWIDDAGGRPQCLLARDLGGGVFSVAAPPMFLGDQSAAGGMTFELDIISSVDADDILPSAFERFVVLSGPDFELDFSNTGSLVIGNVWRHHAVPLRPMRAWTRGDTGAVATQSDFDAVLSALSSLTISGEFGNGNESTTIDNIVFGACSPSGVIDQFEVAIDFGQDLRLEVSAAGRAPFTYVWTKDDIEIDPIANSSALTSVFEVAGLGFEDAGEYRCIISNECGSVTTHIVEVTVVPCPADIDNNGMLNSDDIDAFVIAFLAGDLLADLDNNEVINFDDIDAFVESFLGGCL